MESTLCGLVNAMDITSADAETTCQLRQNRTLSSKVLENKRMKQKELVVVNDEYNEDNCYDPTRMRQA